MEPKGKPDPYAVEHSKGDAPSTAAGEVKERMFASREVDGAHVIEFTSAEVIDAYYIERLGDSIYHHIKTFDAPKVVIDLAHVRHLSSAALGMLIALKKVVEKKGGRIAIANVSKEIKEVFKLTNLHKLIKIHDSIDKAAHSLG